VEASRSSTAWLPGEYFIDRYGKKAAERTPPVAKCLNLEYPSEPEQTRLESPAITPGFPCLAGHRKDSRGASLYPERNCLSREEALRLYTQGSSWFSSEFGKKAPLRQASSLTSRPYG